MPEVFIYIEQEVLATTFLPTGLKGSLEEFCCPKRLSLRIWRISAGLLQQGQWKKQYLSWSGTDSFFFSALTPVYGTKALIKDIIPESAPPPSRSLGRLAYRFRLLAQQCTSPQGVLSSGTSSRPNVWIPHPSAFWA